MVLGRGLARCLAFLALGLVLAMILGFFSDILASPTLKRPKTCFSGYDFGISLGYLSQLHPKQVQNLLFWL